MGIDLTKQGSVKIAVIDSGADVAIDALQGKVDIYRDYTRENILKLKKARIGAGKVIFCDNKRYYLGELLQKNAVYHIGGLDLKKYPALNSDSVYGVLSIVRAGKKTVYIDTDLDGDFSDEEALGIYEFDRGYVSLHDGTKTINIVCTAIKDNGAQVGLSSDYLRHGSFIAALIGGECAEYQGLAHGSRLMIYQVFADDNAEQTALAQAVYDAVEDGAEIINLSLSLPLQGDIAAELDEALDYALAQKVPIVAAAGNYGGAEGTMSYPARKQGVIAVGTLITKEGYALGRGVNLQEDFVPYYSSRAAESYTEFLLAPGCAVSAMPSWAEEGYMFDEGSSTAAAVVTASLAASRHGTGAG